VNALTGKARTPEQDGAVFNKVKGTAMSARQQWVTGLMGLIMLGTILAMPAHDRARSGSVVRQVGALVMAPENRTETPQDQVRDLSDN
jgi:hypothetical protein